MVSSSGAASGPQSYLHSLLPQQAPRETRSNGGGDSLQALLAAFYPAGQSNQSSSNEPAAAFSEPQQSSGPSVAFSPGTMASLLALQGQQQSHRPSRAERAEALFGKIDGDTDGAVSKSEFEGIFGSNADMTKVDDLFAALDANGDGAMSKDELVAAAEASRGAHRNHRMRGPGQGGLAEMLASRSLNGATSESASNADGSTTTTVSYADGSKIAMTVPGAQAAGTENQGATDTGASNLLQRLFRMQAEFLAQSSRSLTATTSVTA